MKIALIGYGKMGQTIERIAESRGHEIVLRISLDNLSDFTTEKLQQADVAIDFTQPEVAVQNIRKCFEAKVPVVCGTTGWYTDFEAIKKECSETNSSLFYATNFSVGVQIFMEINRRLAELMNRQTDYNIAVEEIHHTQKLDAPSGTAITLVEDVIAKIDRKNGWILSNENTHDDHQIPITAKREEKVPGTHEISYSSSIDTIEIKHTAHSREGFAMGAVLAAEFLLGKKGIFTMNDLLQLHL